LTTAGRVRRRPFGSIKQTRWWPLGDARRVLIKCADDCCPGTTD